MKGDDRPAICPECKNTLTIHNFGEAECEICGTTVAFDDL